MDHARKEISRTGLVFVVLYLAGGLLLGEFFGGFADADPFFVDYYSNTDHHLRDLIGGHLFVASALTFLLFILLLIRRLRTLDGSPFSLDAAQASGVVAVALLLAGAAAVMTVTMAQVFGRMTGDEPLTSPAVALSPQIGYVIVFFPGMWAMTLTIGLVVWSAWNTRIWPSPLRWFSVAVALLLPLSWILFLPAFLLPVWVLGVTIWAWRSPTFDPGSTVN